MNMIGEVVVWTAWRLAIRCEVGQLSICQLSCYPLLICGTVMTVVVLLHFFLLLLILILVN